MGDDNTEQATWFVKGAIRYVKEDGSRETEQMIIRNIEGGNAQEAANNALKMYEFMSKAKGKHLLEVAWDAEPEVSLFDPYLDL